MNNDFTVQATLSRDDRDRWDLYLNVYRMAPVGA